MEAKVSHTMIRARVLTTYPISDASRRLRIEPLIEELRARGVLVQVHELLDAKAFSRKNGTRLSKVLAATSLLAHLFQRLLLIPRRTDLLIVHREAFPFFTPLLERLAVKFARVSILDIDDAVYTEPTHVRDWRSLLRDPGGALMFPALFKFILCGNPKLQAGFMGGKAISLFSPTCPSPAVLALNRVPATPRILLWTGSQSTLGSLQLVLSEVLSACHAENLYLHVLGGNNIRDLSPHPRLIAEKWSQSRERELLLQATAGIMPLPDTEWERGKSGYKAILYLYAGLTAIVSPVGINEDLCTDYYPAAVACAPGEWAKTIREVLGGATLAAERETKWEQARNRFDSVSNASTVVETLLASLK